MPRMEIPRYAPEDANVNVQATGAIREILGVDSNVVPTESKPVICIPRVFPNITERRVFAIFRQLQLGFIEKIDFKERVGKDGKNYNMVFVHFRNWFVQNEFAHSVRERLLAGEQVKIVYDDPWFWKVHAYEPKAVVAENRRVPFVDFEFREVKPSGSRPAPPSRPAPKNPARLGVPSIFSALAVVDDLASEEHDNGDAVVPSQQTEPVALPTIAEEHAEEHTN